MTNAPCFFWGYVVGAFVGLVIGQYVVTRVARWLDNMDKEVR